MFSPLLTQHTLTADSLTLHLGLGFKAVIPRDEITSVESISMILPGVPGRVAYNRSKDMLVAATSRKGLITAINAILLVSGSVIATDLSTSVSGVLEEILFEETMVSPIAAYRMALAGFSIVFQAANVVLLAVPYWWGRGGGSLSSVFWVGLAAAFLALNGVTALGALREGVAGLSRLAQ